jgi:hypothetical protein
MRSRHKPFRSPSRCAKPSYFNGLLEAGIHVVTLEPEQVYLHNGTDEFAIMQALSELTRGHRESQRKSQTVGAAWRAKKAAAATKPITAMCPYWLKLSGGPKDATRKFVEIPERVEVVRRIYRMTIDGTGVGGICRILNLEHVPSFRSGIWQQSSVARILGNRAVLGEYQPKIGSKTRVASGEPIPNYYRRIIEVNTFYAAKASTANRKFSGGRCRNKGTNLFTSLIVDSKDGSKWNIENHGAYLYLTNTVAAAKGDKRRSVRYDLLERVILQTLREVSVNDVSGVGNEDTIKLVAIEGMIGSTDARIAEIQKQVEDPSSESVVALLPALVALNSSPTQRQYHAAMGIL